LRGTGNFNISGIFWSRAIERATYENVAVRVLCADTHPDHDTICTFRRENRALLDKAFSMEWTLVCSGIFSRMSGTR